MIITRDYKSTIIARFKTDPQFCEKMLSEAITLLASGEIEIAKAILNDYAKLTAEE